MTKPTLDYQTKLAIIHMGGTIFDERRQATLLLGLTSKCHKNGWPKFLRKGNERIGQQIYCNIPYMTT
jgi:hypothetical protein